MFNPNTCYWFKQLYLVHQYLRTLDSQERKIGQNPYSLQLHILGIKNVLFASLFYRQSYIQYIIFVFEWTPQSFNQTKPALTCSTGKILIERTWVKGTRYSYSYSDIQCDCHSCQNYTSNGIYSVSYMSL